MAIFTAPAGHSHPHIARYERASEPVALLPRLPQRLCTRALLRLCPHTHFSLFLGKVRLMN